jgi:hypothetical protein
MLAVIGALFGASLRWTRALTESEARRIGARTGGRTLFFGGLLFGAFGVLSSFGWEMGPRGLERAPFTIRAR